jgi:tetratricopeptide (TPR) repeat protein
MPLISQIKQHLAKGALTKAHPLLVSWLQQDPNNAQAWSYLAELNLLAGDKGKALKIVCKALSLNLSLPIKLHLAKTALMAGDHQLSGEILNDTTFNTADSISASATELDLTANLWLRLNQPYRALSLFKEAHSLDESNTNISLNYAICLKMAGKIQEAERLFESIIKQQPLHELAHLSLAELKADKSNAIPIALEKALEKKPQSQYLNHAKALYSEAQKDYKAAWQAFGLSKEIAAQIVQFDANAHQQFCLHRIQSSISEKLDEFIPNTSKTGNQAIAPIFVVGMPRSGTSLLEQLLATQPRLKALGELSFLPQILNIKAGFYKQFELTLLDTAELLFKQYSQLLNEDNKQEGLRQNNIRGIDKQPFNLYFVDVILKLFPNAKIIWLVRNKFDTCVGNFRQAYQINSPFHHYSFDWQHINALYDDFIKLGTHWQQTFSESFMRVDYENLVSEPHSQLADLFKFLNIEAKGNPLEFHQHNYFSATASKLQLRQPLNTRSINKFKGAYPAN